MKWLLLFCLIPILLLGACAQNQAANPAPDIPRYTADQVIAVAKAYSPGIPLRQCLESSWKVAYMGQGTWIVGKYCVDRFGRSGGLLASWYFYEDTGILESR